MQLDATWPMSTVYPQTTIRQMRVVVIIYTYTTCEWITDTVVQVINRQVRTIGKGISQVVSESEGIFTTELHVEKSVFISVFVVNLPNTGTVWHKRHIIIHNIKIQQLSIICRINKLTNASGKTVLDR